MVESHPQSSLEIKKALKQTVTLDDGRLGFVFTEVGYQGNDPRWMCHVCCRTVVSERAMSMHLNHPLHNSKLLIPTHPRTQFNKFLGQRDEGEKKGHLLEDGGSSFDKSPLDVEVVTDVVPGEPVPPGMEDVVEGVCQIEAVFDSYTSGPLIGLEYIVELISTEEEAEPRYICLLCEKKGDPRSVMVHVTSQNHFTKYISCFFRTAGNALNMISRNSETRKGISIAVTKVAAEIERHYGRLKPTSAEAETFMAKKYEILRKIDEKQHFRETPNTTFAELVTLEKIKEYSLLPDEIILNPYSGVKKDIHVESFPVQPLIREKQRKEDPPLQKKFTPVNESSYKKPIELSPKEDDDVIIIPDDKNNSIEVRSLSSISTATNSRSSSRSMSRGSERRGFRRSRSRSRRRRQRSPVRDRVRWPERSRRRSSRDRYRERRRSPHLPYSRPRHSISRSRSRSRLRSRSRSRTRSRSRSRSRTRHYRSSSYNRHYKSYRSEGRYGDRHSRNDDMSHERDRWNDSPRNDTYGRRSKEELMRQREEEEAVRAKKLKWEQFTRALTKLEEEMAERLQFYQNRPEKHPKYPDEWKSFWNKRYKELQQAGEDPSKHDFKPEWIIYWDKRMREMHAEEVSKKKEELRQKMDVDDWGRKRSLSNDLQDVSPPTPEERKDVTVDDIKNTWKALTGSDITAPKRAVSPWEDNTPEKPKTGYRDGRELYEIVPPIVHCLRMLSVLETQLGSLGPRILELLSKALALEKTKPSASMQLLQHRDIYLLFETIKEKIRGQLLAKIVLRNLVPVSRAVIKSIDSMLASNPLNPEVFEPVKVAGVGMVDKVAVAQQIASALVAQGKTDVSQHELEELINAVVGMAQASNAIPTQDMSSAAFFSQLNIQNSTGSSHINRILNSMIVSAQKSMNQVQVQTPQSTSVVANTQEVRPLNVEPLGYNEPTHQMQLPGYNATNTQLQEYLSVPSSEVQPIPPTDISDSELKAKLMKFKEFSREEQHQVIALLKELERTQPERVERLREFVTVSLTQEKVLGGVEGVRTTQGSGRLSPFSLRSSGGANPSAELLPKQSEAHSDDDDDDYTFEDVYNAASEKLRREEEKKKMQSQEEPTVPLDETTLPQEESPPELETQQFQNYTTETVAPFTRLPAPSFMPPLYPYQQGYSRY